MRLMHSTSLRQQFKATPADLRACNCSDLPNSVMFVNFSGCGMLILRTSSPVVPWLVTVFLTDLNGEYVETSEGIGRSLAPAAHMGRAKVIGVEHSLLWFMAAASKAPQIKPTLVVLMDFLRQFLHDHVNCHTSLAPEQPTRTPANQLRLDL
jgi:hypothetical protein